MSIATRFSNLVIFSVQRVQALLRAGGLLCTVFFIAISVSSNALAQCSFNQDLYFDPDLFPNFPSGYDGNNYANEGAALSAAKLSYFGPTGTYPPGPTCRRFYSSFDLSFITGGGAGEVNFFDSGPQSLANFPGKSFLQIRAVREICNYLVVTSTRVEVFFPGYVLTCAQASQLTLNIVGPTEIRPKIPGESADKSTVTLTAKVTSGGAPTPGVNVGFTVEVNPKSGGHDHSSPSRPKGTLTVTGSSAGAAVSGTTDANGEVKVVFQASQIAGKHVIAASCSSCATSATRDITIRVPDLVNIFTLPFRDAQWAYPGVGRRDEHVDQHYLTAAAASRMLEISRKFQKIWPTTPKLTLNDASLVWGGKFDISGTWEQNPLAHAEHRIGDNIDIRANTAPGAVPSNIRDAVFRWLRKASRPADNIAPEFVIESVNALHEGIGTANEHFHLRLGN